MFKDVMIIFLREQDQKTHINLINRLDDVASSREQRIILRVVDVAERIHTSLIAGVTADFVVSKGFLIFWTRFCKNKNKNETKCDSQLHRAKFDVDLVI
jgi:hypothetical protein